MSNERRVLVHASKQELAASVAARFITKMVDVLHEEDDANVVLTGGSVGIMVLQAINDSSARDTIDWARVSFWWGDERWLPRGDADRNDQQARDALLDHISVPAENVHAFAASDDGIDLDAAAALYAADLAAHAVNGSLLPRLDITFLGVGPDGHIASLFPHGTAIREREASVLPVLRSPKPPAERLTLTRPTLNASERVWLVLAGADKAAVLGLALAGASRDEVPVAGIKGRRRTVFFVVGEAAAEVPESLIAPQY